MVSAETISDYPEPVTALPETHLDAWRGILNAHSTVVGEAERALAAAGLPPLAWYDVLWAVRRAPRGRLRLSRLADQLTISRGGVSKLVDRLEAAGALRREPCPDDGRGFDAVITPAGKTLLRRMWPVYASVLRETVAAALSEREATVVSAALERVATKAAGHRHAQ